MPIIQKYIPHELQIVYGLQPAATEAWAYLSELVDMLEELLPILRKQFQHENSGETVYFYGVNIAASEVSNDHYTPFGQNEVEMWRVLATAPHIKERMKKWFRDVAELYADAPSFMGAIWETEDTQFPEVGITAFAVLNLDFVPEYTRFLKLWDMDHEVRQSEEIDAIISHHGITAETEELLITRVTTAIGQCGSDQILELEPVLKAHYGDLSKSKFAEMFE